MFPAKHGPIGLLLGLGRKVGQLLRRTVPKPLLIYDPLTDEFDDYCTVEELQRNLAEYCWRLPAVEPAEPGDRQQDHG